MYFSINGVQTNAVLKLVYIFINWYLYTNLFIYLAPYLANLDPVSIWNIIHFLTYKNRQYQELKGCVHCTFAVWIILSFAPCILSVEAWKHFARSFITEKHTDILSIYVVFINFSSINTQQQKWYQTSHDV